MGVIGSHYKEFNWRALDMFYPDSCYEGFQGIQEEDPDTLEMRNITYYFPLCGFNGECKKDDTTTDPFTQERQNMCCDKNLRCDTSKNFCISGKACLQSFLGRVGAP